MTTKKLMLATSLVALLAAGPALAATPQSNNPDTPPTQTVTKEEIKKGWSDTKKSVSKAADKTGDAIERTYDKVKASLLDKDANVIKQPVEIDKRMTAAGIIGQAVYGEDGKHVADVEDIILDSNGDAKLIVVKNGAFLGLGGKLAAFDYNAITNRSSDGDVIMPITQKTIDSVAEFSYDADAGNNKVRVLPQNGYSVARLLDGNLIGTDGKDVADIDNVAFRNGKASLVIGSYGKVLNMGGDNVALDFDSTQLVRNTSGSNVDLKLSPAQTMAVNNLKAAR
jgi:sporulation protein YlmC with PRC-barrel domain